MRDNIICIVKDHVCNLLEIYGIELDIDDSELGMDIDHCAEYIADDIIADLEEGR